MVMIGSSQGKVWYIHEKGDIVGQDKGGHLWVVARESMLYR